MIFDHTNFKSFLKAELADRVSANPQYSLRSLAKNLQIAPSTLSEIISGRKSCSQELAVKIAKNLGLNGKEMEYFSLLAQYEFAKTPELKTALQARLEELNPKRPVNDLSLDVFNLISNWYHMPVAVAHELAHPPSTPQDLANFLGITKVEAEAALERLLRLEILERDAAGKLHMAKDNLVASSKVPNSALRRFHKKMLEVAAESLETQTPQEKFVGSETMAFDARQLPEANEIFEECFQKLLALARRSKKKNSVYHAGIQFFRLNQKRKS